MSLQEDAKKLLPFVQAMADGKTVESMVGGNWFAKLNSNWSAGSQYRIKPEPKLRPYTRDEWEKVDKVRDKTTGVARAIVAVNECDVLIYGLCGYGFDAAMDRFTHLDGSPCGVEE